LTLAGLAMFGVGTAVFGASLVRGVSTDASYAVLAGLVPVLGWIIGITVRDRRAHAAQDLEQRTQRAVHEERLRIARELHDIVAHSMSLIAVKAAVANHVADDRPQETRHALSVIEVTSRLALADLRRALGVLRTTAPYAPMPGLAGLAALAEQARTTGLAVDLTVRDATSPRPPQHEGPSGRAGPPEVPGPPDTSDQSPNRDPETQAQSATHEASRKVESVDGGTPSGLSEGLALAAYRIVQESLTNVVKHSRATRCAVMVTTEAGGLRIQVRDDGAGPVSASMGGQGIIGMRERAALYGGELTAGPHPGGGFVVDAWLPNGSATVGTTA
jgi:signal transduction histidine kinase